MFKTNFSILSSLIGLLSLSDIVTVWLLDYTKENPPTSLYQIHLHLFFITVLLVHSKKNCARVIPLKRGFCTRVTAACKVTWWLSLFLYLQLSRFFCPRYILKANQPYSHNYSQQLFTTTSIYNVTLTVR